MVNYLFITINNLVKSSRMRESVDRESEVSVFWSISGMVRNAKYFNSLMMKRKNNKDASNLDITFKAG